MQITALRYPSEVPITLKYYNIASLATAGNTTLTVAQMVSGLLKRNAPSLDVSDTTPSATALIGALEAPVAGRAFEFLLENTSTTGNTVTLLAGTGVTIVGSAVVAANTSRKYIGVVITLGNSPTLSFYTEANASAIS